MAKKNMNSSSIKTMARGFVRAVAALEKRVHKLERKSNKKK